MIKPRGKYQKTPIKPQSDNQKPPIRKLKNVEIILYSVGILLILISTISFSFIVPKLDSRINIISQEMDSYQEVIIQSQLEEINSYSANITCGILSSMPIIDEKQKNEIDTLKKVYFSDMRNFKIGQLIYIAELTENPEVGLHQSEVDKWKNLPFDQLDEVLITKVKKLVRSIETNNKERSDLIMKKNQVFFWSVIFQVIGLLLNQLGLILRTKIYVE